MDVVTRYSILIGSFYKKIYNADIGAPYVTYIGPTFMIDWQDILFHREIFMILYFIVKYLRYYITSVPVYINDNKNIIRI